MPDPSELGTHIRCCISCREFYNTFSFPNIDGKPVMLCYSCFVPHNYYTNQDNGRKRASIHNVDLLLRPPSDGAWCKSSPGGTLNDRYTYFKIHDARFLDGTVAAKSNNKIMGRSCLVCREMKQLNDYNTSLNLSDSYTCISCFEKSHPKIEPPPTQDDDAIWIQPQAPAPIPIAPGSPTFVKEVSWKRENSVEKVQYTTSPNTWDQPKIEKQSSFSSSQFVSNDANKRSGSIYSLTKEGSWKMTNSPRDPVIIQNINETWQSQTQQSWTSNESNNYPIASTPTPYVSGGWATSSYKNLTNDVPPSNSPQPALDFPPAYSPEPVFNYNSLQTPYTTTQAYNVPNTSYNYDIDNSHNENNTSTFSNDKPQVSSIKSPSSNNSSPTNSSWLSRLKTSIFGSPKNNSPNNNNSNIEKAGAIEPINDTARELEAENNTVLSNHNNSNASPIIAGNAFEAYYHTLENESKPNISIQTTWESNTSKLAQEEPLTWSSPVKREDSLLFNTPTSMRDALKELVEDAVKTGVWEKVQNEEVVGSPLWNEIKEEGWDQPKPLWL